MNTLLMFIIGCNIQLVQVVNNGYVAEYTLRLAFGA